MFLQVKRLQKYLRSKLEVEKKSPGSAGPEAAESAIFFSTSNFDLKCFCSLLPYKNVQYLI